MKHYFIPTRMAILKTKKDINNVGQDMEKVDHSYIARGNVNVKQFSCFIKQFGSFSKKLNIELLNDPTISSLGIYQKELKAGITQQVVHKYLQKHYLQQPKSRNKPNVHQWMDDKIWYMHTVY